MWAAIAGAEAPPTVLLGHSMGGAIAVRAAASGRILSLAGLVVVDVVEGTALQARPCSAEACATAMLAVPAQPLTPALQQRVSTPGPEATGTAMRLGSRGPACRPCR